MKFIIGLFLVFAQGLPASASFHDSLQEKQSFAEYLESASTQARLDELTRSEETQNDVNLLHLGMNTDPVRRKMLKNAKSHVHMIIPYWHNDNLGKEWIELFKEKRAEIPDLDTRFMVDWTTPVSSKDRKMEKQFAEIKDFSDDNLRVWNPPKWLRRWSLSILSNHQHDKVYLVDGKEAILGGMNIGDHYLEGGLTAEGWHDTDLYIKGLAAHELEATFLKTWHLVGYLNDDHRNPFPFLKRKIIGLLDSFFYGPIESAIEFQGLFGRDRLFDSGVAKELQNQRYFPEIDDLSSDAAPVRIIYDIPLVDKRIEKETITRFSKSPTDRRETTITHIRKRSKYMETLTELIQNAHGRVRIFLPYLTLTRQFKKEIILAAERGVQIQLFTNSYESHDLGKYAYYGAIQHYVKLMEAGVEIYEWTGHGPLHEIQDENNCSIEGHWPGRTLHTKAVTIDGLVGIVGSHNMNVRSTIYNSEVMAMVRGRDFTNSLDAVFDSHLVQAFGGDSGSVRCGEQDYALPPRVKRKTLQEVKDFIRDNRIKVLIARPLQMIM